MATKKKNSAFMKPVHISKELEAVVGPGPMPRTEIVKKLWAYIKKNNCQDKVNKRDINLDAKLSSLFGKKGKINMFEMTKELNRHIKK